MSPQEKNTIIISCIVVIILLLFANYIYEHYKCEESNYDSGICKK